MKEILGFIDKYQSGGVEEILSQEDLCVDKARDYLADLNEAERQSISRSLEEIQNALRREEISLGGQKEELKKLAQHSRINQNACLSYLKASEKRTPR